MIRRISLLLGLSALASTSAIAGELPAAEAVFEQLETRLLQAKTLSVQFELSSKGEYPAHFVGELTLGRSDRVELATKGSFGDHETELTLSGIEGRVQLQPEGGEPVDGPSPHLREAMLLGMTRMGLLHNHAKIVFGQLPDHADSGVGDWLVAKNVRWSDRAAEQEDAWGAIAFDLEVGGSDSADVWIWLDADGLPIYREQTVFFEGGSMTAVEKTHVEITDAQMICPPCRQELAEFGRQLFVENGFERVYVCCSGCAAKMSRDWEGYRAILIELGDDVERRASSIDGPRVFNPLEKGVCVECLGGRCERPEHLPRG